MEGHLAQPRYRKEGLGPASSVVTDFVDSPWSHGLTLSEKWMEHGVERLREQMEGRERELKLVCKI